MDGGGSKMTADSSFLDRSMDGWMECGCGCFLFQFRIRLVSEMISIDININSRSVLFRSVPMDWMRWVIHRKQ